MTALDAAFLDIETEDTPMHVGALSVFDGGPFRDEHGELRLDALRQHVASRLHLVPSLRRRPVRSWLGVGRWVWVDDESFDIGRHVVLRHLPPPGDDAQLAEVCAELQMSLLERSRPLWELWFVDGLADGSVAVVEKIHHAMVDGVADVDLALALLDLEPGAPSPEPEEWRPRPLPTETQLLAHAAVEVVAAPVRRLAALPTVLRSPERVRGVEGLSDAARSLWRDERPVRTSLGRPIGHRRTLRWVRRPLPPLLDAAHVRGVTLNDLVLTAVAGGLRALLAHRGELPVGAAPLALVPVSVRSTDEHGAAGNRVSALLVPVPVDLDDTDDRLGAVRDATTRHKAHHVPDGAALLVDAMDLAPPLAVRQVTRLVHHQPLVDVVVTNVPGPPCPLYLAGACMRSTVPIVPLARNLDVSIGILSYDGTLTFGLYADADACPDLDVLVSGIGAELDRLAGESERSAGDSVEPAGASPQQAEEARSRGAADDSDERPNSTTRRFAG
jgi:diacylglycerol O-acyltransferase